MAFDFKSDNERFALEGDDVDIYPRLGITNTARWNPNAKYDPDLMMIDPENIKITGYHYSGQPGMLPLALNDLQQFIDCLNSLTGYWPVLWLSDRHDTSDHLNADGFRCVVAWGSIDLTVRPVQGAGGGPRLSIYPGDVRAFLYAASNAILKSDPVNPIAGVIGRASMASTKIPFEWQIAHAPEDMRTNRVKRWRYKTCGTARDYTAREGQYLIFLRHHGLPDPREGKRTFHNQGRLQRKRINMEMDVGQDVGQDIGPSFKRRSTGSSQWGSESHSSFSSTEHSRAPSVAGWDQPIMGPPPSMGPGQPSGNIEHPFRHEQSRRGSRGSRGSISSGASHAGSRMASLTFQSPGEGSSEGMGPPPEGSSWGGPQGVARRVPGPFGGGYEAQAPFHGYQGPGQGQHAPAYGQPTEVFGHVRTDFQGPPQREFQVGIQHTQQFGAYAGGNLQHPYQRGHEGFVDAQSGRGYAGGSGHNMPGFGDSNIQGGGGYPRGFAPTQPVMHGGQFDLPQQPQHTAAGPPEGGHDRSILGNIPRVHSPEPLDPTAAQSGQGNIPPNFPSGMQPMYQHQDMPPLPPSAMSSIDPAQLLAPQTTLPPVGQNSPSSMPPATQSMPAELIHSPEHDVPEHSNSESESEGEDGQSSYQHSVVIQPLLDTAGQDNGRFYASPGAEAQPTYGDPYMGAGESDDE